MKLFYSKSKIIKGMLFKKYYNEESGHKCVYLRPWYCVDLSFFPFTCGLGLSITWRSDVKSFSMRILWINFEIERTIQCEKVI